MRSIVLVLGLFCLAALSACAKPKLPLADVTVIKAPDDPDAGLDIYAARRLSGENVPNLRGNQIVEIRTYLAESDDLGREVAGQEISGAMCHAILDTHRATVRTPGAIHVPIYGYVTAPFSVTCKMDGFQDSVALVEPYNKTIADRRAATTSAGAWAGLFGALVATVIVEGINASSDETNDEFQYAVPEILMRPGTSEDRSSGGTLASAASTPEPSEPPSPPQATQATAAVQSTVVTAPASTSVEQVERNWPRFERDISCSPWCRY